MNISVKIFAPHQIVAILVSISLFVIGNSSDASAAKAKAKPAPAMQSITPADSGELQLPDEPAEPTAASMNAAHAIDETQSIYGDKGAILIGHNVTPSTDTLKAGVWTVGNYAVALGLTDNWFIATSPWIWVSYNTANFILKWSKPVSAKSRIAIFADYFHSYNSTPLYTEATGSASICKDGSAQCSTTQPGRPGQQTTTTTITTVTFGGLNRYQWENFNLHFLYSQTWNDYMVTYFNVMYSYFWNDDLPYSIRMDPGTDNIRGQLNTTTLTEFRFGKSDFYFGFELGVLGDNYLYPYMQLGTSFAYISHNWMLQLGASYTAQWRELMYQSAWSPGRYDSREHISKSENQPYYYRYLQTAMHPEIQIQYFF